MRYWLLTTLWVPASAHADPVGDPLSVPSTGRVTLDVQLDSASISERDRKCSGEACDAQWQEQSAGVHLGVSIVRGVGIYGEVVRTKETLKELEYVGKGLGYAAGVHLAFPIRPSFWIAGDGRFSSGQSNSTRAEQTPDPKRAEYAIHSATLMMVVGHPERGGHLWMGAQSAWSWSHDVWPMGDQGVIVEIPLKSRRPVSGVVGGTLISDPVGIPWLVSPRIRVTAEGRAGQENAVSVSTGLAY